MRFYCPINANPRQIFNGLGSSFPFTNATFKRRDAASVELQLYTGDQASAMPYQLPDGWVMRFGCKAQDDYKGDTIVLSGAMAWRPIDQVYAAEPSFGTFALAAMFGGATRARRYGIAHTLTSDDLSGVLTFDVSSSVAVTVPVALGSGSERVWIVASNSEITLVAASGVTITNNATIEGGSMMMLTRTAVNAWTLSEADVDSLNTVQLMGEFSWWHASHPEAPTSVDNFVVIVNNDVLRGDEGEPVDGSRVSDYVTHDELATGFVKTSEAQSLTDGEKAQARANIGALGEGDVVTVGDQDLTSEQQAQVRDNIDAPSVNDLEALSDQVTAQADSLTSLSGASVKTTAQTLTTGQQLQARNNIGAARDTDVVKVVAQTLTDDQKAIARANIGAEASVAGIASQRLAALWNPVGNGTSVHLNGALNAVAGTPTARNVTFLGPQLTIASYSGSTITMAAPHTGVADQPCQFVGTTLSAPLVAGTWYYVKSPTSTTLQVAATPGGAAIALSGVMSSAKLMLKVGPAYQQRRLGYVSAATAGSAAGTRHSALQWAVSAAEPVGRWKWVARWQNSDAAAVANARCFIGMAGTSGLLANANPSSLLNIIGAGADSGDANLSIMHNDGTGSATKIDLGPSFPANTRTADAYELILQCNPDVTITFTVTNLTTGSTVSGNLAAGTNLPSALTLLAPQIWRNNGSTAAAVGIDVIQWILSQAQ